MNPKDVDIKYKANQMFNKSFLFKKRTRNPITSAITPVIIVVIIFIIFKISKLFKPQRKIIIFIDIMRIKYI